MIKMSNREWRDLILKINLPIDTQYADCEWIEPNTDNLSNITFRFKTLNWNLTNIKF
jgi:hypothetical protein